MKYIFDSSAIYSLISKRNFKYFSECATLTLARYELGNIIWKERSLHKRINLVQQREWTGIIEGILARLDTFDILGHIDGIINLSSELSISFYDAAYVFFAIQQQSTLVTADEKLIKKIGVVTETINPNNLI